MWNERECLRKWRVAIIKLIPRGEMANRAKNCRRLTMNIHNEVRGRNESKKNIVRHPSWIQKKTI